ncbi:MAG: YicC/YloC family endoribonuclease [Pseudomonadota bacterium]
MITSMTGFAAQSGAVDGVTWTVEMRSVNAKGLDIRLRLPEVMQAQEAELRKRIAARFGRGNIQCTIRLEQAGQTGAYELDEGVLAGYLEAAIRVRYRAKEKGLKLEPSRATDFLSLRGVLAANELAAESLPMADITASFELALDAIAQMRAEEGRALSDVLHEQCTQIASLTARATDLAQARKEKVAQQLKVNLAQILETSDGVDPDRVAQELALLAVKSDIREELDRLGAHVQAAQGLLENGHVVGRKLDFLMQEFNREANTLCSKSNDPELTRTGLDLKAVIDQMREQVQNVE